MYPSTKLAYPPPSMTQVMGATEDMINGFDVKDFRQYIEQVRKDPSAGERNPKIVAQWVGGTRSRVEKDGVVVHMGGDEDPSAMWMFLASLTACDVEVVATHASLLGIEIEHLEIEAKGHFDIHRLLGLDGPPPGYDKIGYTIRLRARGATTEKIEALRRVCERASPVGDSMSKAIPLRLEIESS
jgi:uncharacterized OsmC-like protein